MTDIEKKKLTHVAGTLLIEARAAFLNGAGLAPGEARTTTTHKTFRDGKHSVPYVSAQAWRRWLRRTLIEETGWPSSEIRAIAWSRKGTTSKVGGQTNPVDFAEDDLFGYMRAAEGQGSRAAPDDDVPEGGVGEEAAEETEDDTIASVMRASPFATSVLASIRSDGWQGRDDGFVHVQSNDPEALEAAEWLRTFEADTKIPSDKMKKLKKDLKGNGIRDQLSRARAFAKEHNIADADRFAHAKPAVAAALQHEIFQHRPRGRLPAGPIARRRLLERGRPERTRQGQGPGMASERDGRRSR